MSWDLPVRSLKRCSLTEKGDKSFHLPPSGRSAEPQPLARHHGGQETSQLAEQTPAQPSPCAPHQVREVGPREQFRHLLVGGDVCQLLQAEELREVNDVPLHQAQLLLQDGTVQVNALLRGKEETGVRGQWRSPGPGPGQPLCVHPSQWRAASPGRPALR